MSRKVTNEIKTPFFATFATFKAPTIMTAGTAGQKQTLFAVLFSIFFAHLWTLSSSSSDTQPPPHLSTNLGALLVTDKRVFTGPLGRSLRSFARSLRSAPLRYTPFTGSLTRFAHSLVGQLKLLNMCSHCYRV